MSDDTKPAEITAEVTIEWTEWVLPTPRHRKRQPVTRTGTETAGIRSVTSGDAPLAFTVLAYGRDPEYDIRSHGGALYSRVRGESVGDNSPVAVDSGWLARAVRHAYLRSDMEELEVRMRVGAIFTDRLAIDGELWKRTTEPQYLVATFGMGDNHGGTSLMYAVGEYRNHSEESYFLADEFGEAVAAAVRTAEDRGDNRSVERILALTPFVVHDESKIATTVSRVIRLDLPSLYDVNPSDYTKVRTHYLNELSRVPGAIVKAGKTRTVDPTVLTDRQKYAVKEFLEYPAKHWLI